MTLPQYLAKRRYWEFLMFLAVVVVSFLANLGTELIERGRFGASFDASVPVILEATSHVAMALSIPLLLWFNQRVPIRTSNWLRSSAAHIAFSVVFSVVHVTLMYWARVFIFGLARFSMDYRWDNWLAEFAYEYLKDFRTYFLILALVYLYDFVIRRLQGEAGFLTEEKNEQTVTGLSDRFLVKKLGREFLVRIDEIEWIESCGNYVNLHVGGRVYPLRETMTRIDERLVPLGFQRVHRSAIVNLNRVAELVAFDSGDGQAKLVSEVTVPVSRRFRQELRERLS
jgi:LytTr DNA-binding domain